MQIENTPAHTWTQQSHSQSVSQCRNDKFTLLAAFQTYPFLSLRNASFLPHRRAASNHSGPNQQNQAAQDCNRAPGCSQLSLGLINGSRAEQTRPRWVTGPDVHALPCSWACCHYGPNQYNHSSCRDILGRTGSRFDIMLMPNFEISSCSAIEPSLWERKVAFQTPHNPKPLITGRCCTWTEDSGWLELLVES